MRERGRREGKSGERREGGEDGKRRDGGKVGWKDEGGREERENVRKKGKRGDWRTQ